MSAWVHCVFVLVVIGAAGATWRVTSCDPVCEDGTDPGTKVADPKDCSRYYVCLADGTPSDVPFDCPEGEKFDPKASPPKCRLDGSSPVTCGYCDPPCTYDCPSDNEVIRIAFRGNCSWYFICGLSEDPFPVECPPGEYFNGEGCVEDIKECCDPCLVVCDVEYTEVADPTDCTKFYYCGEGIKFPQAEDRHQCPEGESFYKGHCQYASEVPCEEPCAP